MKYALLLLVSAFLTSCSSLTKDLLKDPEVSVLDFKITNVTLEEVAINLNVNVKNPNPIPLSLGQVSYALNFSGQKVTEGVFDKGINIPASGENSVMIPLKFKYSSVNSLVSSLLKNTFTKDYEITGLAKMGLFSIPFSKKGEVKFTK